ncbi:hypothetical protein P0Y35_05415 [Kiritimatiellaeota bacterium B1221]|nr:hypothetical protein [Kiritimatiellaeota bacterium B1221]
MKVKKGRIRAKSSFSVLWRVAEALVFAFGVHLGGIFPGWKLENGFISAVDLSGSWIPPRRNIWVQLDWGQNFIRWKIYLYFSG